METVSEGDGREDGRVRRLGVRRVILGGMVSGGQVAPDRREVSSGVRQPVSGNLN